MKEILSTHIKNLDLSVRIKNAFHANGIETVRDIISTGLDKISLFRGCGRSSQIHITDVLLDMGLDWKTDIAPEPHHTITFKSGKTLQVPRWVVDEIRRLLSDQRLLFKNFTKDGEIHYSINIDDISFIE